MSLPLCPSKICTSGFNSPPHWPHHLRRSTPTHPTGLRLTPTVFQQARKAASILRPRASEATVGVPGGVACHLDVHLHRPGKWSWQRRTPLALATRGGADWALPPTFCLSPPTELQKSILLFLPRVLNPCTLLVQYHDHYKSEGEADTTLHNLISTNLVRAVTESRPFLIVSFPAMHINKFFSKNNGSAMCYRLGTIRLWTRGGGSPDHGRCLTGFEKWQTLSARSCLHGYQQLARCLKESLSILLHHRSIFGPKTLTLAMSWQEFSAILH